MTSGRVDSHKLWSRVGAAASRWINVHRGSTARRATFRQPSGIVEHLCRTHVLQVTVGDVYTSTFDGVCWALELVRLGKQRELEIHTHDVLLSRVLGLYQSHVRGFSMVVKIQRPGRKHFAEFGDYSRELDVETRAGSRGMESEASPSSKSGVVVPVLPNRH